MDQDSITRYITDTFASVEVVVADGNSFFFNDPERKFPFATIMTNDDSYDSFSNLNRPSVFRLNIGVGRKSFKYLFAGVADGSHDLTALDRLMPHPVYGKMYWVCVLNPSEATFKAVRYLLAEAYDLSAKRYAKSMSD